MIKKSLLLVLISCYSSAQTASSSFTFEVASVRMSGTEQTNRAGRKAEVGSVQASTNSIRFSRPSATLAALLVTAYGLPRPQQLIGPEWLTSERYEIEARAREGTTAEQQLVMLQNLLADRFHVKLHHESRELPVYQLVIANGGTKLKQSEPGATTLPRFRLGGPFKLSLSKDGSSPVITLRERGTMEELAIRLSSQVDRPILDSTGLKGDYDVVMRWMPMQSPSATAEASEPGLNIFDAFRLQLGLKLEPKKGMIDVLVVDHAEKVPTAN